MAFFSKHIKVNFFLLPWLSNPIHSFVLCLGQVSRQWTFIDRPQHSPINDKDLLEHFIVYVLTGVAVLCFCLYAVYLNRQKVRPPPLFSFLDPSEKGPSPKLERSDFADSSSPFYSALCSCHRSEARPFVGPGEQLF